MEMNVIMQYISYLFITIGGMAFLVSVVTQVIKTLPWLNKLPTQAVVIVLSLILCPTCFVALMSWQNHQVKWYMIFSCIIVAFIVALVSMGGWEKVSEIWKRTKYNKE